jgi:hypothetical protein
MLEVLISELKQKQAWRPDPKLPYVKSINIWINAALRKMGREDKVNRIKWCVNETIAPAVARAKYIVVFNEYIFTMLEFAPTFFYNTTSRAQRREIVYHEVAHVVDSFSAGYNGGHGKNWKRLMKQVGMPAATTYDLME